LEVKVSALFRVHEDHAAYGPTHVVSMLDPRIEPWRVPTFPGTPSVLQLFFYDDDELELQTEPLDACLGTILAFLKEFIDLPRQDKRLLVHCHAGASRSPAVAYVLFAMKLGEGREPEAFDQLLGRTTKPWPNRHLVEIADGLLQRHGRLLGPLDEYRRRFPRRYSAYMRLNRKRHL
jgi:predicted protein tyrosine phosphatase